MLNLFDIARQAGGGAGLDALGRQLGLDGEQARRAVEALLPAFSLAFQRSAQSPQAFGDLLGLLGSGRFVPFFDVPGASPPAAHAGFDLVGRLFGTPEAARGVAAQVAAMTGVGAGAVQSLMPALARMLLGGMTRQATLEGYADLLRDWSDKLRSAARSGAPAPADPWTAWSEAAAAALRPEPPKPPPPPDPFGPWTDMVGAMMGAPPKAPEPPPPPPPSPFAPLLQMFDAGREAQAQHLAAFQSILDAAWGTKR